MKDFYYRVFTGVDKNIWADEIETQISEMNLGFELAAVVDEEDAENPDAIPSELVLYDEDENPVASLVYDRLETSDFLAEEIAEFTSVADEMSPRRNREWVKAKLASSVGCYCFTVYEAGFFNVNWDRMTELAAWLREETNGIEQSDSGQITNEQGQIVLVVPDDDGFIYDDDDEVEEDDLVDLEIIDAEGDFDEEDEDEVDVEEEDFDEEGEEEDEGEDEFEDEYEEEDEEDDFDDEEDEDDVDDDEFEEFEGALLVNNEWVVKVVDSEEAFEKFVEGEA